MQRTISLCGTVSGFKPQVAVEAIRATTRWRNSRQYEIHHPRSPPGSDAVEKLVKVFDDKGSEQGNWRRNQIRTHLSQAAILSRKPGPLCI